MRSVASLPPPNYQIQEPDIRIVDNANICNIDPNIASASTGLRPHLSDKIPNGTVMRMLGMQSKVACHPCNVAK